MHYSLIEAKRTQVKHAKKQLKLATHDDAKLYWSLIIKGLTSDLEGPPRQKIIAEPSFELLSLLRDSDLSGVESHVFGTLLVNEELIVLEMTKIGDRGKIYRSLTSLIEKNLVVRIPTTPSAFHVLNKSNPLLGIINRAEETRIHYTETNEKIIKLMASKE